ncbi:hypothetical protein J0L38_01115 [Stenotrophomonas maltophilia]|nr:hypothetical protein [Stenotrophomonas maltophilia]
MNAKTKPIELHIRHAVAGRFKIEAHRVDQNGDEIPGSRRLAADWFNNLIVNAGLNYMGSSDGYLTNCLVGSGSSDPQPTDTQLQTRVASTTTTNETTYGSNVSPRYGWKRITFRFAAGAAAGNLSEVGVGWSSTAVFSRARILDGAGNPTTITVLSDEVLDVTYEFRAYINEADINFDVTISGTTYACVMRPANVNGSNLGFQLGNAVTVNANNRASGARLFETNVLGTPSSAPGGVGQGGTFVNSAYAADSFARGHVLTFGLNVGNFPTGAGAITVSNTFCDYQTSFTPKIPKDATNVLTLQVRSTWGRHVP